MKRWARNGWIGVAALGVMGGACLGAVMLDTGASAWAAAGSAATATSEASANVPVFYGAKEITLQKGAVDTFDKNDARFRVFARDFEDGDLSPNFISGEVNVSAPGNYEIKYDVTDSDGNKSELTLPVHVLETEGKEIDVVRTVYAVENDWNLQLAGFSRCDTGTRQILGVYLPAGESIQMRVKDGPQMGVALLGNDSQKEASATLPAPPAAKEGEEAKENDFKSLSNDKNADSVPLLTAPMLAREADRNTVFTVEIKFDAEKVHPLNYYYEKDDQTAFQTAWEQSGDEFAVVEGQTILMVLPKGDMKGYESTLSKAFVFKNYDEHLAYYEKVVDRMDEIVGLSYTPKKETDRNVRMKYLVKANAHGAGAAYYAGNHVGINNASMTAFFEMNWGGLHELAHGYQGYLGKGTMDLGETSNNILGHYIQMDKELYTFEADWLGKLDATEEARNAARSSGTPLNRVEVVERLYAIINLFDGVAKEENLKSGAEVYAGMFSYYREQLQKGAFTSSTPNQDVYARYMASAYNINILPYWNAWHLEVSEETREIVSSATKALGVLADEAGDKLEEVMKGENATLKYGLIDESKLAKYGVKGDLTVVAAIDEPLVLEDKTLTLERGGKTVEAAFQGGKATFDGLEAGSYLVHPPVRFDYAYETEYVTVNAGTNTAELAFTYAPQIGYHPTRLKIRGVYDTVGYYLTLSDENRKGTIQLGGANLGNQTEEWKGKPDEVFASVTIRNKLGKIVDERVVKGNGYFAATAVPNVEVELGYGYTVEVFTHRPEYVRVLSLLTNQEISEYNENTTQTRVYEITREGLLPRFIEGFSVEDALYNAAKETLKAQAESAAAALQNDSALLENALRGRAEKRSFLESYDRLRPEDRTALDALAKKLRGGVPKITLAQELVRLEHATDELDWSRYLSATDEEDGAIALKAGSLRVLTDFDHTRAGVYDVTLAVSDSDGNEARCSLTLVVEKDAPEALPEGGGSENGEEQAEEGCGSVVAGGGVLAILLLGGTLLVLFRKRT